ncbi:YybH family protein [Sphingomonas sp. CFBP 8760]|uniref:YybH family protein n=1 Tax=Sphingomonas sp. CFBP 8760 TaxID=2775282 RepID=UPI0017863DDD|nr:SgcJ/EcaC family oxidoreductase [Sphingomonas sp. CFBP 8760]MBD8547423.1 SgcJ/EcaC family oxidoreductase [Sphingomonas sp. CFBP 8760]
MIAAMVQLAEATTIAAAMAASAAGWNAGDLDRFMAVYADDAVYVTARGVVRGKAAIAARYAPGFTGGGNTRGKLSFAMLVKRPIDATHRVLIARWTLTGKETQSGYTTLVFARRDGHWRIVTDHSS